MSKKVIYVWIILFLLESLLITLGVYAIEIKEIPLDIRLDWEQVKWKDKEKFFLIISPDGKHTIGNWSPVHLLLIDGKLESCDKLARSFKFQLFSNPWDNRILLKCSHDWKDFPSFFSMNRGPYWQETLLVGNETFLKNISSKYHVLDFWLEPVSEQKKEPQAVLENRSNGECVQYLNSQTTKKLDVHQTYWQRTFVSPSGEQTVLLGTDINGKQYLKWENNKTYIIQDCDAIHNIRWFSEILSFEIYDKRTQKEKIYRWRQGAWQHDSEESLEFEISNLNKDGTFQIQYNSHIYGPFTKAHSLVYSLHRKHMCLIVQLADVQKWGFLTNDGLYNIVYDYIIPVETIPSTIHAGPIETNNWHTLGIRDGKWYRINIEMESK